MASKRSRVFSAALKDFLNENIKTVIGAVAVFAIGIILGVTLAYKAVGGEFETVARVDAETGAGKVFFLTLLALIGCYGVILIAGLNRKTVVIVCVPFLVLGFVLGRFATALIMRYEVFGMLNFVFIYLPAYLATAVLFIFAAAAVFQASCLDCREGSRLKPSFISVLKIFAVNAAVNFVFFIIIGSIMGGVIVVKLF